jgi:NADPH-dependent 7-cyano-7-deazaguanine reductase QueF
MRIERGENDGRSSATEGLVEPVTAATWPDRRRPSGARSRQLAPSRRFCPECGHLNARHEGSVEDEFATSHGGVGYAYCAEVVRSGESADLCGCRSVVGSARIARGVLWPAERPNIATIPSPGPPLTSVRLVSTEVTTTDPVNGQPDFEHVEIRYVPDDRLIDSKSLKAYWLWWRGRGASIERLSTLVALDVAEATGALTVDVTVHEAPRGGISIVASSTVTRKDSIEAST